MMKKKKKNLQMERMEEKEKIHRIFRDRVFFTPVFEANERRAVVTYINMTIQILDGIMGMLFCRYAQAAATPLPSFTG